MASLINAVRSICGDPLWIIKLGIFAAVLVVLYDNNLDFPNGNPQLVPLFAFVYLLMFGSAVVTMHRNINNKTPLLPGPFSILDIIIKSLGGLVAVLPASLLYYVAIEYIRQNIVFEPFVMTVIYIIVTAIFSPFIFVPLVLFSAKGNIIDAFKIKNILDASGNFVVQFLSFILQYAFIVCTVTYLVYITLLEMLGDHISLLILKCIVIVISSFIFLIYCSDMYQDVIPEIKEKTPKKLKRKIS